MINKTFSVATFILVAWLSVTLVSTSRQLSVTEQVLLKKIETNQQSLTDRISDLKDTKESLSQSILSKLENQNIKQSPITAELNNLKAETKRLKADLARETHLKDLKTAYKHVIETEIEKEINANEAADKLLSTKEAIWKASMEHQNQQKRLRGLMGPIDSLAEKWKRGDTENTVKPVFDVLRQTLVLLHEQ